MRVRTFAILACAVLVALLPVAAAQEPVGNPCARTYVAGSADGTYVYTSPPTSTSVIAVGVVTNAVGGGASAFVVVQPANCGGTSIGEPSDPTSGISAGEPAPPEGEGKAPATPIDVLATDLVALGYLP